MKRVQKVQSLNKLTLNAKLRKTVTYFNQCLIVLTQNQLLVYQYQPCLYIKKTQQNNLYFVSIIVAWESEDSSSLHMFDDLHSIFTLVET